MEGNAKLNLSARRGLQLKPLMPTTPKKNIQPENFIDKLSHQKFNDLFIS